MVRRLVGILSVSVVVAIGSTAPALARGDGAIQATDPSANSPAGVTYSIPLDSARQDASPHGHHGSGSGSGGSAGGGGGGIGGGGTGGGSGGTGGGSGAGSGSGGSSGVASGSGGSSPVSNQASGTPVLVPGGQPGSLVHSSNGFGSSSKVPGVNSPASAGLGSVQSNASSAPLLAFLLAAVVLLLGGYVGLRAWHSAAARPGAAPPKSEPPQLPPPTQ